GFVGVPRGQGAMASRAAEQADLGSPDATGRQVSCRLHVEVAPVERAGHDSIGIDLGLSSLVTLSNGETAERTGWTKRPARKLRRRHRAIARCKRGSKTRAKRKTALAKFHARVGNRPRDHIHKVSRDRVDCFGRIAIEDLNVKGLARSTLAKHVADALWAQLA